MNSNLKALLAALKNNEYNKCEVELRDKLGNFSFLGVAYDRFIKNSKGKATWTVTPTGDYIASGVTHLEVADYLGIASNLLNNFSKFANDKRINFYDVAILVEAYYEL